MCQFCITLYKNPTIVPSTFLFNKYFFRDNISSLENIINIVYIFLQVITKVFLSNNHNQQGGQPIMFTGDSGHQTIRIVGGNATQSVAPSPTKTITLAQARQMGLLSPGKLQQIIPGQKVKFVLMFYI